MGAHVAYSEARVRGLKVCLFFCCALRVHTWCILTPAPGTCKSTGFLRRRQGFSSGCILADGQLSASRIDVVPAASSHGGNDPLVCQDFHESV